MSQLAGKIAFITGGSRGIGRATALLFAENGADIAFNHYEDDAEAETVAEAIRALGRRAFHRSCDMGADAPVIHAFVEAATAALGAPDILVNNAGINIRNPFEDFSQAEYERVMNVHARGMFLMAQAVYPGMVARGAGRIINVASQIALKGAPMVVPYAMAKAAIVGMTRALAYEATPKGVLVNAVAPGPIVTDLTAQRPREWHEAMERNLPMGRLGQPIDIAYTALLLAGPGGSFYCGATLSPNGGDVMH
jgi:3-oxoacyl-[acyl-carrier protein] reductase